MTAPGESLYHSWLDNAPAWIQAVRSGVIDSRRVTDRVIVEAVMVRRPQRVLDLGCGEGWLVRALVDQGVEAVGVDAVPALVKAAGEAGPGTYHVCTYTDLVRAPARVGQGYDVIVANFALLDEDIAPLLRALKSLLAEGGVLIVQTLHPLSVGGEYCDGWRTEDFDGVAGEWRPMPWYFRTLSSWMDVLMRSGYVLAALSEPRAARDQLPLSLLMVARPLE